MSCVHACVACIQPPAVCTVFADYTFEYISMVVGGIGLAVEGMFLQWWLNTMVGGASYICTERRVQTYVRMYVVVVQQSHCGRALISGVYDSV